MKINKEPNKSEDSGGVRLLLFCASVLSHSLGHVRNTKSEESDERESVVEKRERELERT